MKIPLAITDLTRMQRGCVCVAGYDKDGHCIRPTLPSPGIREASLFVEGQTIVFPFAVDGRLKEQHALGLAVTQLAKAFERNEGAIRSRLRKLGLV